MKMTVLQTGGDFEVNTYIVPLNDNNVFVVDPADCEFCGDRFKVVNHLKENGLNPVAVVLTHGHFDHVTGLKDFRATYPDVPILIHVDDRGYISENSEFVQGNHLKLIRDGMRILPYVTNLPPPTEYLLSDKTLGILDCFKGKEPELIESLNKWTVLWTPGHTPGGVCLYNAEEKTLISGDTIFYQGVGRWDRPLADEEMLMESVRRVYRTIPGDTRVYPGHELYGFELKENF